MRAAGMGIALLLATLACEGGEPPAEALTWQEANKRSAALIREKGPSTEAADLARLAFDLYPQQTKSYSARNHAQLLLNLADARGKAQGEIAALREIDQGSEAIALKAGSKTDVLITVWQEAARIAGRGRASAGRYSEQAWARSELILGSSDPRTINLLLDVVQDMRAKEGYTWALSKYVGAREAAARAGEDSPQVVQIDLLLAKLNMEHLKYGQAIEAYRALIDRLERRTDRDQENYLQMAYAQLEYTYEQKGEKEMAAAIRARRNERLGGDTSALRPTYRVAPSYPRQAARDGYEGYVLLTMDINPDGTVADAKVIDSSPPGVFDYPARQAILKWKFQPKVVDGQPVRSSGTQLITFNLTRNAR